MSELKQILSDIKENAKKMKEILRAEKSANPVDRVVIPLGAEPIGNPPRSWRIRFGQAVTVGDVRRMLESFDSEVPLMVRNGPLPTLFYHYSHGEGYVEFD